MNYLLPILTTVALGGGTISAPVLPQVASASLLLNLQADSGVQTSNTPFTGTGTITQGGNTSVLGQGTMFFRDVAVGDRIVSNDLSIDGIVTQILAQDLLLIDTSTTSVSGNNFSIDPQASSQRVTAWNDQSGAGHHFTESLGAQLVRHETLDGRPFVSLAQGGLLVGPDFADNLGSFAVFCVGVSGPVITKMSNYATGAGWSAFNGGTSFIIQEAGGNNWIETDTSIGPTGPSCITCVMRDLSTLDVYVNGDKSGETDNSSPPVHDFSTTELVRLGSYGDDAGWQSVAPQRFYAVLIYSPAPSGADRVLIENWLKAKWGL